jgi:hypothetical protein
LGIKDHRLPLEFLSLLSSPPTTSTLFSIHQQHLTIMVQVSTLLAVAGCLLSSSSVFVSGSPLVPTERDVAAYALVDGPIEWRGTLEEGKEPVHLTGDSFDVCFRLLLSLNASAVLTNI